MLLNRNTLRRAAHAAAPFVAASLFVGGLIEYNRMQNEGPDSFSLSGCQGRLAGIEEVTFSKDGPLYRATRLENGCVPITDPITSWTMGALAMTGPGAPTFTACRVAAQGERPAHLSITVGAPIDAAGQLYSWMQGDVATTPDGMQEAINLGIPTCKSTVAPGQGELEGPQFPHRPDEQPLRPQDVDGIIA